MVCNSLAEKSVGVGFLSVSSLVGDLERLEGLSSERQFLSESHVAVKVVWFIPVFTAG